ncbi:hypothetical protein NMG60_11017093 [Bertholletia excelsa]
MHIGLPSANSRYRQRAVAVVKASKPNEGVSMKIEENKSSNRRKEMLFMAATAAVYRVVAKEAMVEEDEPKPGSADAKKKYAPIYVTTSTACICCK